MAGSNHRRVVLRLLVGLACFVLVYVAMMVGCVAASYVAIDWALHEPTLWPLAIAVALVFAPLLCFLLVPLLHRPSPAGPTVRLDASAHPRLLAAIESLAREAQSPRPGRISLGAGVNAAMVAGVGRPELVIGLGLVNVLDVRELEAVLAHEFGHFAQSSMRVGQWAQRVTLLLRQQVLGRTRLDVALTRARGARSWLLRGLAGLSTIGLRGLRRTLAWLLYRLTRLGQAFSRELEFDADLHAVALRGSDPLVAALWRAQRGALAMNAALAQLAVLCRHGVRSEDVYAHQLAREAELDERLAAAGDPMSEALRRPYSYGPQLHFPAGEAPAEIMWYSHPSYLEREANAKRDYVAVDDGPRPSAWSLFEAPEQLRREVSELIYEELAGGSVAVAHSSSVAEVEARLADELAERHQGAHHHGFYDNRIVDPGDLDTAIAELEGEADIEALAAAAAPWRGAELAAFMARWRELDRQLERLRAVAAGRLKVAEREARALPEQLRAAEAAKAELVADAHRGDRAVFRLVWALADADQRSELLGRYRFSSFVQSKIAVLNGHHAAVARASATIDAREYALAAHAPVELLAVLDALHRDLDGLLQEADAIAVPELHNIDPAASLVVLLTRAPVVEALEHEAELGPWLRRLMVQVAEVHQRLRTLHYKNLGRLLSLHEQILSAAEAAGQTDR